MTEQLSIIILKLNEINGYLKPQNIFFNLSFYSTIILWITLVVLIWYTVETHKLAVQSEDANLRPIILRGGYLKSLEELDYISGISDPLKFVVLQNIATDISGYLIRGGKKHKLLFGGDITRINETTTSYLPEFGWISSGNSVFAIFKDDGEDTNLENQIIINYRDIQGGKYITIEDKLFKQKAYKQ